MSDQCSLTANVHVLHLHFGWFCRPVEKPVYCDTISSKNVVECVLVTLLLILV
jgi:hypothetical protein